MIICIDIDGTLTVETEDHNYEKRTPNLPMIKWVRAMSLIEGHTIIIHTARWEVDRKITEVWLKHYNIPYDRLILGKPKADLYIDDKAKRPEEILSA